MMSKHYTNIKRWDIFTNCRGIDGWYCVRIK